MENLMSEFNLKDKKHASFFYQRKYDNDFVMNPLKVKNNGDMVFNLLLSYDRNSAARTHHSSTVNPETGQTTGRTTIDTRDLTVGSAIICYQSNQEKPKYVHLIKNINEKWSKKTLDIRVTGVLNCTSGNNVHLYHLTKNKKTKDKEYRWNTLNDDGEVIHEEIRLWEDKRFGLTDKSVGYGNVPNSLQKGGIGSLAMGLGLYPIQISDGELLVCFSKMGDQLTKSQMCKIKF